MYESRSQYRKLVEKQVKTLESELGYKVRQGQTDFFPRCMTTGKYDLHSLGFIPGVGNSIYFSSVFNEWRCRVCDFKMCA
ncbi:MAG: hypothetical protein C0616_06700 [Desulfuromonas sp.]|nr:MAG: hypothetical protein C0616_06700 [Desulfuromonas sp.]